MEWCSIKYRNDFIFTLHTIQEHIIAYSCEQKTFLLYGPGTFQSSAFSTAPVIWSAKWHVILHHTYSFFNPNVFMLCITLWENFYGATLRMSVHIYFFVSLPQVCEIALPSCLFLGRCCEIVWGRKPEERWKSFCGGLNVWSWSGCYYDWKFVFYLWTWKSMFKAFYFNHFWHILNSLTHDANSMEQTPFAKLTVIQLVKLPICYEPKLITVFTEPCHWFLCWTRWIHSTPFHCLFLKSI